jgi:hypothetical protein
MRNYPVRLEALWLVICIYFHDSIAFSDVHYSVWEAAVVHLFPLPLDTMIPHVKNQSVRSRQAPLLSQDVQRTRLTELTMLVSSTTENERLELI